jgi:hypothetical protein
MLFEHQALNMFLNTASAMNEECLLQIPFIIDTQKLHSLTPLMIIDNFGEVCFCPQHSTNTQQIKGLCAQVCWLNLEL